MQLFISNFLKVSVGRTEPFSGLHAAHGPQLPTPVQMRQLSKQCAALSTGLWIYGLYQLPKDKASDPPEVMVRIWQ